MDILQIPATRRGRPSGSKADLAEDLCSAPYPGAMGKQPMPKSRFLIDQTQADQKPNQHSFDSMKYLTGSHGNDRLGFDTGTMMRNNLRVFFDRAVTIGLSCHPDNLGPECSIRDSKR